MHPPWTSEQIEGLAYDKYGVRASRTLSTPEKWLTLGHENGIAWGLFPNRTKPPLRTAVSLDGPRFSCTCANYKFPCNHSLALISLYLDRPDVFTETDKPGWIDPNLQSPVRPTDNAHTALPEQSDYQQRHRIGRRMATLVAGLRELELWLHDMVRHGFAALPNQPRHYWTQMADRLVDAQASEVAREVRLLATIPGKNDDWPEQLLAKIGRLQLLIQGFHHFDALTLETQTDLQTAVGWSVRVSHMTPDQTVRDRWQVVGQWFERVGKKKVQRIWLWGETTNRPALIVEVTHDKQRPDMLYVIGTALDADLYFHPSTTPLQADIVNTHGLTQPTNQISGFTSIEANLIAHAEALAVNPWLAHFPVALHNITAESPDLLVIGESPSQLSQIKRKSDQSWLLQDTNGYILPLPEKFENGWHLRAIASEGALHLFGEWDGRCLHPLSIWKDQRWLPMNVLKGVR